MFGQWILVQRADIWQWGMIMASVCYIVLNITGMNKKEVVHSSVLKFGSDKLKLIKSQQLRCISLLFFPSSMTFRVSLDYSPHQ
jgi:hypothetical protein